ncbi:hypothetical protein [Aliiglaciecola litoralis]|uniref:PEP-CTERM protein-sorting domain-containing protein n=1 Tax=Aliiglaciecola litoralis TaxID=582857 RepID=A0ABP3X1Y6_9ALTE
MKFIRKLCVVLIFGFSSHALLAAEILVNGGFETGDFTGWNSTLSGGVDCWTDWTIGTAGSETGCLPLSAPTEGTYAAYNAFDGFASSFYTLSQDVILPNGNLMAELSFDITAQWFNGGALARVFDLNIVHDGVDLGPIYHFEAAAGSDGAFDWTSFNFDISDLLSDYSGNVITIEADVFIPEQFTGPGGFGLDNVSLNVSQVSEPSVFLMFLMFLGLIKASRFNKS